MIKTPKPVMTKPPKPTKPVKTPKPVMIKTPKPTAWSPPKTPRPTMPPKTPKPTKRPTRDQTTYITPEPTAWAKNSNLHANIVDSDVVEVDYGTATTAEPTPCDGELPTKPPKTPRPSMG